VYSIVELNLSPGRIARPASPSNSLLENRTPPNFQTGPNLIVPLQGKIMKKPLFFTPSRLWVCIMLMSRVRRIRAV
jgi:hypothetical protein